VLKIDLEWYAGYRGEETHRVLYLGDRRVEVTGVLDQWLAPEHRYFKVRGEDGAIYLLRHDAASGRWDLTMFQRRGA
jgi:hypothetical protein